MAIEIKPQKHQKETVHQLHKAKSLIASHGLGSGKTLTSILAGERHPEESKLVVAPAALLHNYKKELHKFNIPDTNYHLVSYEKFRKNPNAIVDKYKPSLLIADEFHRTKDPGTLTGDSIRDIRPRVKRFLGLSGSIAQNHPSEIAELLHTATGHPVLGNTKQFKQYFIHEKQVKPGFIGRLMGRKPGIVEEPKHLDKFKEIASKYINTFKGDAEYSKHIPKIEYETKRIGMNKEQQKVYDYTFGKSPRWLKYKIKHNLPPSKSEATNINAFLIGARQASSSTEPFGVKDNTPKIDAIVHDLQHGLKHDKNFKGVVYSSFLDAGLHPLGNKLKKLNIPFGSFTGEQTNQERNDMIHNYNKGKLKTLLLSPAGGEGLDLKGTKYLGIMNPSWNPSKTNQVIGRGARYKSHEKLPEAERKLHVVQYLSEPRSNIFGKVKKFFKPSSHNIGVDEYVFNRAAEKEKLNRQFTEIL